MVDLKDLLTSVKTDEPKKLTTPIYKAVKSPEFGVDINNKFVTGLTLEPLENEDFQIDPLQEEIDQVGSEASILLPEEGLKEGSLYDATYVVTGYDYETGYADMWEIHIEEVKK